MPKRLQQARARGKRERDPGGRKGGGRYDERGTVPGATGECVSNGSHLKRERTREGRVAKKDGRRKQRRRTREEERIRECERETSNRGRAWCDIQGHRAQ
ncbi:hypothetical protein BC826DRAFT_612942 [Russula brevipes]|nr:hypothetical protein BC826DRAFT_612942 [Russula brevipes]